MHAISRTLKPAVRKPPDARVIGHDWDHNIVTFRAEAPHQSFHTLNPLYPLPAWLLESINTQLPNWLSDAEIVFERGVATVCQRHGAVAFFCGLPVRSSLALPEMPTITPALFKKLKWDRFFTLEQCRQSLARISERRDPLCERLDAYRGWLMVNPQFLHELAVLRARWTDVVTQLKRIPWFPVSAMAGPCSRPSRACKDVTDEFAGDFNRFYDRWELAGLATWDLPEPRGGNFSGAAYPSTVTRPATAVTIETSPILPIPGNFPLREIVEEAQRAQMPEHLEGWRQIVSQKHPKGLRYESFRNIGLIQFYRNIVLPSRYSSRFAGHVEAIDRAFADFLDTSEDSVKKLRLQIESLRTRTMP